MSKFIKPEIRISEYAYDALVSAMKKRKMKNLSDLIEKIALDLELADKIGGASS